MSKKTLCYSVYQIHNTTNNKRYIGIDSYFPERKHYHFSRLRRNQHPNKHLQSAFNKYGEAVFKFSLLKKCTSVEEMKDLEKIYIFGFDSYNQGYNKSLGGESTFGRKQSAEEIEKRVSKYRGKPTWITGVGHSQETKDKISKANIGKRTHSNSYKPVCQYTLSGEFIAEYPSITDASNATGIGRSSIASTCLGLYKTSHNFKWKYKEKLL